MTPRDKIHSALAHRAGPVPVDFGSTGVTGMHASCVAGSPYGKRRLQDFFVRHLLGKEPRWE